MTTATITIKLWAEHTSSPGKPVVPHDCRSNESDDVLLIEGTPRELIESAKHYHNRKTSFGFSVRKSILEHLRADWLLLSAEVFRGWLYYSHPDRNVYVSSGGVDTGLKLNGEPIYMASGVTIDEGEGAVIPADVDEGDVSPCWVLP